MIKFEVDKGELKAVAFGGSMDDIVAEIALQITLIYGAIEAKNKDAAKEFRRQVVSCVVDPEIADTVFSSDLYNNINKNKGVINLSGKDDVIDAIMELLK